MDDVNAFKKLLIQLLPKGDAWVVEPATSLDDVLTGVAKHFLRVDQKVAALKEVFFKFAERYPRYFASRGYPLNLSRESIEYQLKLAGFNDVTFWVGDPTDDPFKLYFKRKVKPDLFHAGSPAGSRVKDYHQESFEETVMECKPAHVSVNFIYEEID